MEKLKIKAGSIKTLTDARFFASKEVDMVGFCFDKNADDYIEPFHAQEIMNWLEGPAFVGEFGDQPVGEIKEIMMVLDLDYVQLPVSLYNVDLEAEKILQFQLEDNTVFNEREKNYPEDALYLLSFAKDLQQKDSKIASAITEFCQTHRCLLDVGADVAMAEKMIDRFHPYGINIKGDDEAKLGEKSFDELEELFELLEESEF